MKPAKGHPHSEKAEVLLVEWLLLLMLLLASQERLQRLALLEGELKRPGQALIGKSGVDPGDYGSAQR